MKSALLVLALAGVAFSQTCTVITNVGCFTTASTKDSLTYHSSNGQMTHELCMALCFNTANTNAYAGLSLGINCYCGDPLSFSATTASNCTTPCGGSSLETCGGVLDMTVLQYACNYNCVGGSCSPQTGGPYTDPDCSGKCGAPGPMYACNAGSCELSSGGTYSTPTCDNQCTTPTRKPSPHSSSSSNLSGGSIFLLVLFVGLLFPYLVGGVLFNKYKRQLSGIELIPNIEFWRVVLKDIKDGFRYTFLLLRGRRGDYQPL
eukprot:m.261576 g.261576  ORF g.261576 m.261576 type:complete len:261 (+) comp54613_c0_seq1:1716-2498(+)